MICPKCGAALADNVKFCNACGALQEQSQPQQPQFQQPVYQQPTYAQQVYQDRQKAVQYAGPQQSVPQKPKKKFPVAVVVIAAAVLLVCAAALILGLAFGKQTVYLPTEQVTENQTGTTTYTYEYTEDGQLTFYQVEIEYNDDYSYMEDVLNAVSYTYDKKGILESVEFEMNGESYEYEYVYDKEGNLKTLEGDNQEFKVKCDEEGRITSVKSADDDSFSGKYSYHDNGILKKVSIAIGTVERELRYNEQGKLLSNEQKYNGNLMSRTENTYDEDGNVIENVAESYSFGTLIQTITTAYTYEEGMAVAYEIEISTDEASVTILFETDDDGLERTFEVEDIEIVGDDMGLPDDVKDAMEQFHIEMVYDEQGNLLEMNMELDEMGFSNSMSYSYVAVKVPKGYAMIYQDPIYFQAIDPSNGAPASTEPVAEAPAADY